MKSSLFFVAAVAFGGSELGAPVEASPALEIQWVNESALAISWVFVPPGSRLEASDRLGADAVWQPWADPPRFDPITERYTVRVGPAAAMRFFRLRLGEEGTLPPDPASVAPPLPETVVADLHGAVAFLYEGESPVQEGVAPGAMDPVRTVVLRGAVMTAEGAPLPGVHLSLLRHPEFGWTWTRADGRFDLVVNGGGRMTVVYRKEGYLRAQRTTVTLPWQDYVELPAVALVSVSARATPVALGAATIQVARGDPVADADGSRQATLIVPPETQAELVFPDGRVQPLASLTVRATELTVGENGPAAMPAELPPGVGYTYCVDLRADEAAAAGGEVRFDRPLFHYVENFLNFPVGGAVPVGYYDETRAAWVPSDNGRIIAILAVTEGLAAVDVDGSGTSADAAALAALGMTDDERRQLAQLYAPGQSLWRVPITHFSGWDFNWGWGPNPEAKPPAIADWLIGFSTKLKKLLGLAHTVCGTSARSFIEDQNQVLHERIPLTGCPFDLHYSSLRAPGRRAAYTLEFPLSFAELPPELKRIEVEIRVAGKTFRETLPPEPNLSYTFEWDGRDAYGRVMRGTYPVSIRVGYVYPAYYQNGWDLAKAFGYNGNGVPLSVDRARSEFTFWREWQDQLGTWDARGQGLGGWTLGVHHVYDPVGSRLWLGSGPMRAASSAEPVIRTVAGGGEDKTSENILAVDARLWDVDDVTVAPDGTLYLVRGSIIRRVAPDGYIETYAGGGRDSGEFVPAREARLFNVRGLALAPDGSLYFSQSHRFGGGPANHGVRVITPDGLVHTVVNASGLAGFAGDGGPAIDAQLNSPERLDVGPDGSLYIADMGNNRIRKVAPDGLIQTVAGGGESLGEGVPARQARLIGPKSVAVTPDGSLYIAQFSNAAQGVRRVSLDGLITTLTPASGALDVTMALNGDVLVTGRGGLTGNATALVWRVNAEGEITALAGMGGKGFGGDGGPAYGSALAWPMAIAVGPRGTLYVSANDRVREISQALPGFNAEEIAIPSADGRRLYHFSAQGRHLRTLDARTGAVLLSFHYDVAGRLQSVDDGQGNITTIERDATGAPTAIVAPFGQRTELQLNAHGWLQRVTDPAGRATALEHTADGLLTQITRPGRTPTGFRYDDAGRLLRDEDAQGGFVVFERQDELAAYTVTRRTAEGAEQTYRVEQLETGQTRLVNRLSCCGTPNEVTVNRDGSTDVAYADGTLVHGRRGPDPRFGMEASVPTELTIQTPGGLAYTAAAEETVELQDPLDPLSLIAWTRVTDLNGRVFTRTYAAAERTDVALSPAGRTNRVTLDERGRPIRFASADLEPVRIAYDARGRIHRVRQGERTVTRAYDPQTGYLASVTDALGRRTRFERDALGRTTTLTLPDATAWGFAWNEAGQLVTLNEPDATTAHTFTWTPRGRLASYRSPLGATNRFFYDLDRRPSRHELPSGERLEWIYDSAGRLSEFRQPGGRDTYVHEATSGHLTNVVSLDGQRIAYTYDGSLLIHARWSGVAGGEVAYAYNHDLRLEHLTYGGQTVALAYDDDGLLVALGELQLERDAANGLPRALLDGDLRVDYDYDAYGQVSEATVRYAGQTLATFTAAHDALGRLTHRQETLAGETHEWAYEYDLQGRLTVVRRDGAVVEQYDYDAVGNRIGLRRPARGIDWTADDYAYNADQQLLRAGDTRYECDPNGRLARAITGDQITRYTYRADGALTRVELPDGRVVTYQYDAAQRRIAKAVDGVIQRRWVYGAGLTPLAEYDGAGALRTVYYYPGSAVPAAFVRDGQRYRVVQTDLTAPRLILDEEGNVVKRVDYDAFGGVRADSNPAFDFPFGWVGGLADPDTGLVRFGARDYDPATGRWTAPDPILFAGGFNLYAYTTNDPVNRADWDGLASGKKTLQSSTSTQEDAFGGGVYGCRPAGLDVAFRYSDDTAIVGAGAAGVGAHTPPPPETLGPVAQALPDLRPAPPTSPGAPGSSTSVEGQTTRAGASCDEGGCSHPGGGYQWIGVPEDYMGIETSGSAI